MKRLRSNLTALALLGSLSTIKTSAADDTSSVAKPVVRPEVRRPLRDLSLEEREARFKEMEQRFGPAPFTFDELRRMMPEERQTKMREWREGRFSFSAEERLRRRAQIRQRLTRQIGELQKARSAGKITEEQARQLERLELLASRFDRLSAAPLRPLSISNSPAIKTPR